MITLFNNYYKLKISGKNLQRYIKYLYNRGVDLYSIVVYDDYCVIKVDQNGYNIVRDLKTVYKIDVVDLYGFIKIKDIICKYNIFLLCCVFGFLLLLFLSNVIFSVEVIHNKSKIRDIVYKELESYGIKKFGFVKSYSEKERIVNNILKNNTLTLEWLEIERIGVKYIVRVEERIMNPIKEPLNKRHIVASKNGIIMSIDATSGEIVRKRGEYVKKGDIIISGNITKGDKIVNQVAASGKVYGETWYQVTVDLPLSYKEIYETGNSKKRFNFTFLNKSINLFDFSSYKQKKVEEHIILGNNLLPIKLSFNKEEEIVVIDEVYTIEKAISKASEIAREKLMLSLGQDSYILSEKSLNIEEKDSTIKVVIFFMVYEDITSYSEIAEVDSDIKNNE